MQKCFKVLQDSISVSIENLKSVAENTTGDNGLLLNSVIDTLQEQQKVVEHISNCLDTEMGIKNRCFDFLCKKGLINEFYRK
jgi:hypothetical protein